MAIYGINNFVERPILEVTIDTNKKLELAITGDGQTYLGWGTILYFKVFKRTGKRMYCSRIMMDHTFYVYPGHSEGDGTVYYLDSNEIDIVANMIEKPGAWDKILVRSRQFIDQFYNQYAKLGIYSRDITIDKYPLLNYRNLPSKNEAERYDSIWLNLTRKQRDEIMSNYR